MSLVVDDLSVRYGNVRAARTVSFTCEPGEILTIVGPNGAGKSSVLYAIAGASQGTVTGNVTVDGADITGQVAERVVRRGVALVPEGRRIFNSLSVLENLRIGATLRRDRKGVANDIEELLDRFPSLAKRRDAAGGGLSGGEAQQLAIARSLLSRPKYLLLDEPSLGLAPLVVVQILEIVRRLRSEGHGVVLVEQNAVAALELADRAILMRSGELRHSSSGSDEQIISEYFASTLTDESGTPAP